MIRKAHFRQLWRLPTSRTFSQIAAQPVPSWASADPYTMGPNALGKGECLIDGKWRSDFSKSEIKPDPLTGEPMTECPDVSIEEAAPFVERLKNVPRSGLHNPLKNPERYVHLGEVTARVAAEMSKPEVETFFAKFLQRVAPKSEAQCRAEVRLVAAWHRYMSGDTVRNLGRSFGMPGDRQGMTSCGYRFPFGGVGVITPFNFPIEISSIQSMSAMLMGNQPIVKTCNRTNICFEQMIRLWIHCGLEPNSMDFIHCQGPVMQHILVEGNSRNLLFTGSQKIAELLCEKLKGRVKLEDAGFDWKVLGPDVGNLEYVSWQADNDAYGHSGQKCSAQSIVFAHENWVKAGFFERITHFASQRNLNDLTIGPVLTHTTEDILEHTEKLASIPGARVLFGGKELKNHSIPKEYGAVEPTCVFVPFDKILDNFTDVTREIFGPFQVATEYKDSEQDTVLKLLEMNPNHLTAAVVSQDFDFLQKFLGNTFAGTTYAGMRARTTAAPQQLWFGPCGDPRSGGIHTPEAIQLVWSGHREVIWDMGKIADDFQPPPVS